MDNMKNNKYVFIGGTGRSGTNIFKAILAKHSEVASLPFEHRFIIDPDGIVDFLNSMGTSWSPFMTDTKLKRLNKFLINLSKKENVKEKYQEWELSKWFPNYIKNVEKLNQNLTTFIYRGFWPGASSTSTDYQIHFSDWKSKNELYQLLGDFIIENFNDYLLLKNKSIFVEDNTWNILFANDIKKLVPNSKLINMIRDPRDVIASFVKQRWCPSTLRDAIKMYKSIINRWLNIEKQLSNSYYKTIKLEDLVLDKIDTLKDIAEFLGVNFENSMLDIDTSLSNSGRWQNEFDKNEKKIIESELTSLIKKLGYAI